jgi:hypothetical protein
MSPKLHSSDCHLSCHSRGFFQEADQELCFSSLIMWTKRKVQPIGGKYKGQRPCRSRWARMATATVKERC